MMKKFLQPVSIAIICILIGSCRKDEQGPDSQSFLLATIDNQEYKFGLLSSSYSQYNLTIQINFYSNAFGLFKITLRQIDSLKNVAEGGYPFGCEGDILIRDDRSVPLFATNDDPANTINITNAVYSSGILLLEGTMANLTLIETVNGITTYDLQSVSFAFLVPDSFNSSHDFISFSDGISSHTFYTRDLSDYDTAGTLVLTANLDEIPMGAGSAGASIVLIGFSNPPTAQTVDGITNGLRLYFNYWTDPTDQCSTFKSYNSLNNPVGPPDDTTVTISDVVFDDSGWSGWILTGTFSGSVTTGSNETITLANGTFKVKIPGS